MRDRSGHGIAAAALALALAGLLGVRALGPAPIWDAGMSQVMLEVDDLAALRPDPLIVMPRRGAGKKTFSCRDRFENDSAHWVVETGNRKLQTNNNKRLPDSTGRQK